MTIRWKVDGISSGRLTFVVRSRKSFFLDFMVSFAMYSVRQKSIPESFFAIFLAIAGNFYMKCHTFITHS